jgi:hypothetical protein
MPSGKFDAELVGIFLGRTVLSNSFSDEYFQRSGRRMLEQNGINQCIIEYHIGRVQSQDSF